MLGPLLLHTRGSAQFDTAAVHGVAVARSMAWLAFVKLHGVAPTAPGQWPSFLAFYAGAWVSVTVWHTATQSCSPARGAVSPLLLQELSCCPHLLNAHPSTHSTHAHTHTRPSNTHTGFWAVQNFLRPLRISLALALAPVFDTAINRLAEKLGVKKGW